MTSLNDDCDPHIEESDIRHGLTVMKKVIHARSRGERFEVKYFIL